MNVKDAYDNWSKQYDTNINKTRDLEAVALRSVLENISFSKCLEIGCGTGKNTTWFINKAEKITAVDLSEDMVVKAKEKVSSASVEFIIADITKPWTFVKEPYNLISFSLVLEHIEDLDFIFKNTADVLEDGGWVYVGELHPFKQYSGSKARFETEEGLQVVTCYNHHFSDFTNAAKKYGLEVVTINEFFDENDRSSTPRILSLLFKKSTGTASNSNAI